MYYQKMWRYFRFNRSPLTQIRSKQFFHRSYATYKRFDNSSSGFDFTKLLYNRNVLYGGLAFGAFYVYNLHEAPFTHRLRFIWIPYWLETKIGDMSYRSILSQYGNQILPAHDPHYGMVTRVMNKLLSTAISNTPDEKQAAHLRKLKWTIHIIQVDPHKVPPNAFILPNGKIFVFSSILPICKNEDGLATVLSHELSHQLAHHSSEQLSKQPIYIILSAALYSISGSSSLVNILMEGLLKMPASRDMESEADRIGCELMARSCFKISEAVYFWSRMYQWESSQTGIRSPNMIQEFFSTHPNTKKRIESIQQWMPDLERIREASNCFEYQMSPFNDALHNFFKL